MKNSISITLPNGIQKSFPVGTTGLDMAQSVQPDLVPKVLAITVNGATWDATRPIDQDAQVELLTWQDRAGQQVFWHSSAHLLAEALEALYPGIQFGIGPPIAQGFYYDVDLGSQEIDASHFPKIEAKMLELAQQKNPYQRIEISKQAALAHFQAKGDSYKVELLGGLADGSITFYRQGQFTDLCKGPHIPHTGHIKAVKLLNLAGAYWRGDVKRKQLTRIYGITFPSQAELKDYLKQVEEAQKRSHQKLGKELGLFTFSDRVGLGLPLWLPRGTVLREQLTNFLRRAQERAGYQPVITPHIGHKDLYVTSGHYDKYGEHAFQPIQTPHTDEAFLLKPMNCPHHCEIYQSAPRSYKDLPLRFAEFGTVYRYEQHGALHGLARTRCFTQDDAHIFCSTDQVQAELEKVIILVKYVFEALGFTSYEAHLSLRSPEKVAQYIGHETAWTQAEEALQKAITAQALPAQRQLGEAAFYGPKLDFMVKDALGRDWQLGTVQLDYQLPERFDLTYIGPNNEKHRPVMIHRAPFGSLERFIAILLEHTAGKLPLWLAPDQVMVLPLSATHITYAHEVLEQLQRHSIRALVDTRDEKLGKKIRDAELQKIPYMLIVGDKEAQAKTVAIRQQGKGTQGAMSISEFLDLLEPALVP